MRNYEEMLKRKKGKYEGKDETEEKITGEVTCREDDRMTDCWERMGGWGEGDEGGERPGQVGGKRWIM